MKRSKIRRQIAWEAARLMFDRRESEYYQAKMKAARYVYKGWVKPADLPSNAEIRDEIQNMSRMFDGQVEFDTKLREMRMRGLHLMTLLADYRPRLIGSVLTGHIRRGSDIDLHVFADNLEAVSGTLDYHGFRYEVERKEVHKQGELKVYRHLHIQDRYPIEVTVYPTAQAHLVFKSSITGKAIERASINELKKFLCDEYPGIQLAEEISMQEDQVDPFQVFYHLLLPLENVMQNPQYHPEGDALYHSLQVFDLACDELPYDEEFLTAALLHDVGKGLAPHDHVAAGLEALQGLISDRTAWLIEHHMEAHKLNDHTIGARARKRLQLNENYAELVVLGECDRAGRTRGVATRSLEEAIDYLRELDAQNF